MNIIVRYATADDYDAINDLAYQLQKEHVKMNPNFYKDTKEVIKKSDYMESVKNNEILVSVVKNNIVGYLEYEIISYDDTRLSKGEKVLRIDSLIVDENFRGNRISVKLLDKVRGIGVTKGCDRILLSVNSKNLQAIKVYEKYGFIADDIRYSIYV